MNACLTVCTALRTLEMLILKSVESNLFDNAHFIFIRNNPTEVLGVRVLLIYSKMATLKQNALLLCQHRRSRFQTEHQ
jgi:hypothetical protein